jgi:hypothetical protein
LGFTLFQQDRWLRQSRLPIRVPAQPKWHRNGLNSSSPIRLSAVGPR